MSGSPTITATDSSVSPSRAKRKLHQTGVVPTVSRISPASGSAGGGTPITITGTGFVAGGRLEIGQGHGRGATAIAASSVDVVSSTQITAVTGGPARPGTFAVYVLEPGVISRFNQAAEFTYTRPAASASLLPRLRHYVGRASPG